jgi:hypothetical protein
MSFQFASSNLVLELGVILWVLMGWQFTMAEFVGGPIMIVLLVLLLRRAMTPGRLHEARAQAERGIAGRMEGHAAMDMSLISVAATTTPRIRYGLPQKSNRAYAVPVGLAGSHCLANSVSPPAG